MITELVPVLYLSTLVSHYDDRKFQGMGLWIYSRNYFDNERYVKTDFQFIEFEKLKDWENNKIMEENKTTIVSKKTVKSGITFGSALGCGHISYTTW